MARRLPVDVFKFGGTSVGSPEALRLAIAHVRGHLRRNKGGRLAVVVSAMSGVTDLLLAGVNAAAAGDGARAEACASDFIARHETTARQLLTTRARLDDVCATIATLGAEYRAICQSVLVLREASPRTLDAAVARGERVLARLFAHALEEKGTRAAYVDAQELILVERRHGSLWPAMDRCKRAATQHIRPLLDARKVAIVPGYIGRGPGGEVVTLGRGGTDFSAALVAALLGARAVTLYKEVDGLMTADPRRVPEARVVPEMHYREAAELAYYGAKVLHPRTMIPLVGARIPLYVKNTFNAAFGGTRIAGDVAPGHYPVKALSAIHDQALVSIEGKGMMGVPGIAGRTFSALSRAGHSVTMISQASSEASICFVVPESESGDCRRVLEDEFQLELGAKLIDAVKIERHLALIAVVGLGMRGTPGIAARTFASLAAQKINIHAIAQGSSELNITVTIAAKDTGAALKALHREFQLDKLRPLADASGHEAELTLFGYGQIGRALASQLGAQATYFRHDLGLDLKVIALADRSGLRVEPAGFSAETLAALAAEKKQGGRLKKAAGKKARASVETDLRQQLWPLPVRRGIFVDMTAEDSAAILSEALTHGFHVVVANKKPLAVPQAEFDALFAQARARGLHIRYEATVGAGLPVLDTLDKLKSAGDPVEVVLGCLSGTLGYLMTQIEQGVRFSEAVRAAHALGYTEPDPREDLSGMDVGRKALILARTLGRRLDLGDVLVEPLFAKELSNPDPARFIAGLSALDDAWIERNRVARAHGAVLRYVARIDKAGVRVGIEQVKDSSAMGRLSGTDNQIVLHTKRYKTNPLVVTGPGAGAEVTAAGVLNDIVAIATGRDLGRSD